MRLIEDDHVPGNPAEVFRLLRPELVGDDDDGIVGLEGARLAGLDPVPVALGFQDHGGEPEFVLQFLHPLLAQGGRHDQENAPLALRPPLRDHQSRLDGFAQAHLVGQNGAARDRRLQREQRRIDLMRVHFDARGGERLGERIIAHALQRDAVGKVETMIRRVAGHYGWCSVSASAGSSIGDSRWQYKGRSKCSPDWSEAEIRDRPQGFVWLSRISLRSIRATSAQHVRVQHAKRTAPLLPSFAPQQAPTPTSERPALREHHLLEGDARHALGIARERDFAFLGAARMLVRDDGPVRAAVLC